MKDYGPSAKSGARAAYDPIGATMTVYGGIRSGFYDPYVYQLDLNLLNYSLGFFGIPDPSINGSAPPNWVLPGTTIDWDGLTVVYAGSSTPAPDDGVEVTVTDGSTTWNAGVPQGQVTASTVTSTASGTIAYAFMLNGTSEVESGFVFVDGTAPVINPTPTNTDTFFDKIDIFASFTDSHSGLDMATARYRVGDRTDNYSAWMIPGTITSSSATHNLTLQIGDNWVQWTVDDLLGNTALGVSRRYTFFDDSDGDGTKDLVDDCPWTPGNSTEWLVGCPDLDGDGMMDEDDWDMLNPGLKYSPCQNWGGGDANGTTDAGEDTDTALVITHDGIYCGQISSLTDLDGFQVTVPAGKTLKAGLKPGWGDDFDISLQTVGWTYNATTNIIAASHNLESVWDNVTYTAPGSSREVFIVVHSFLGDVGFYTLVVEGISAITTGGGGNGGDNGGDQGADTNGTGSGDPVSQAPSFNALIIRGLAGAGGLLLLVILLALLIGRSGKKKKREHVAAWGQGFGGNQGPVGNQGFGGNQGGLEHQVFSGNQAALVNKVFGGNQDASPQGGYSNQQAGAYAGSGASSGPRNASEAFRSERSDAGAWDQGQGGSWDQGQGGSWDQGQESWDQGGWDQGGWDQGSGGQTIATADSSAMPAPAFEAPPPPAAPAFDAPPAPAFVASAPASQFEAAPPPSQFDGAAPASESQAGPTPQFGASPADSAPKLPSTSPPPLSRPKPARGVEFDAEDTMFDFED